MIKVKIIADSVNVHNNSRVTTFELDYPRYIHSEIMTHRMFGRNAQSSRAVPVAKTLEVNTDWVKPIVWGANKAGMSSNEELRDEALIEAQQLWNDAAESAFDYSKRLADVGLHKQWSNRITEPFSLIKVVITATEWDNFFWLRMDSDAAQPEIVELATQMKAAYDNSTQVKLEAGMWHMPYIDCRYDSGVQSFWDSTGNQLTLDEALKISASCCAQVSYRRLNDSKEKAIEIFDKLFSGPKPHLSPCDHIAKVIPECANINTLGVTHVDRTGNVWSGNLKNFIQYRHMLCLNQ